LGEGKVITRIQRGVKRRRNVKKDNTFPAKKWGRLSAGEKGGGLQTELPEGSCFIGRKKERHCIGLKTKGRGLWFCHILSIEQSHEKEKRREIRRKKGIQEATPGSQLIWRITTKQNRGGKRKIHGTTELQA